MADRHIDYWEVSEYGHHFIREVARFEHIPNPFVDVTAIKNHVLDAVRAVEAQRTSSVIQGSSVRGGRQTLEQAVATAVQDVQRFFYYLRSVPATVRIDAHSFFAGGMLGKLTLLKPADLLARIDDILSGFESPQNRALPEAQRWQDELSAARASLDAAISGRSGARSGRRQTTAGLVAARNAFLRVYNGMAKRMIYGLLVHLEREAEYRELFLDLQVDEGGGPTTSDDDAPSEPDNAPELPGDEPLDHAQ